MKLTHKDHAVLIKFSCCRKEKIFPFAIQTLVRLAKSNTTTFALKLEAMKLANNIQEGRNLISWKLIQRRFNSIAHSLCQTQDSARKLTRTKEFTRSRNVSWAEKDRKKINVKFVSYKNNLLTLRWKSRWGFVVDFCSINFTENFTPFFYSLHLRLPPLSRVNRRCHQGLYGISSLHFLTRRWTNTHGTRASW